MGIAPQNVPGHDPDREPFVQDVIFPTKNLNLELKKFRSLMTENEYNHFKAFGVSKSVVDAMKIGYNGRYIVYPYFLEDGNCYAARCVLPDREEDSFWHGDETFFSVARESEPATSDAVTAAWSQPGRTSRRVPVTGV